MVRNNPTAKELKNAKAAEIEGRIGL